LKFCVHLYLIFSLNLIKLDIPQYYHAYLHLILSATLVKVVQPVFLSPLTDFDKTRHTAFLLYMFYRV